MRQRLSLMLAALWWGSATAVGAWVVPQLFMHLGAPAVAGAMAARLFATQTWVALVCGLLMLLVSRGPQDASEPESSRAVSQGWILAGMLATAVMTWGVSPRILAREQLALWHSVGTALYAVQWFAAGLTLWRLGRVSPVNVS
jgi:hypothetical protein